MSLGRIPRTTKCGCRVENPSHRALQLEESNHLLPPKRVPHIHKGKVCQTKGKGRKIHPDQRHLVQEIILFDLLKVSEVG